MDRYVLSANLVNALQNYLVSRPFGEVANLVLALQQQVAAQMPAEQQAEAQPEQSEQLQ